jgi:4'-phosphopantetheinyl transferase
MHPRQIHLHFVDLDAPSRVLAVCRELLDFTERDRARRFLRKIDGDRWVIARAGLKDILGHYCGVAPGEIRFRNEPNGKPEIDNVAGPSQIHFNLSHSGPVAAVAVTRLGPVGVDIEYRRPIPEWKDIASRFFSSAEYGELVDLAEAQREGAFLRCWTRKEATIKATGEGLSAELDSFDVSLAPGRPPQVLRYRSESAQLDSWRLWHFETDRFVGALAICQDLPCEFVTKGYWSLPGGSSISQDSSFV